MVRGGPHERALGLVVFKAARSADFGGWREASKDASDLEFGQESGVRLKQKFGAPA